MEFYRLTKTMVRHKLWPVVVGKGNLMISFGGAWCDCIQKELDIYIKYHGKPKKKVIKTLSLSSLLFFWEDCRQKFQRTVDVVWNENTHTNHNEDLMIDFFSLSLMCASFSLMFHNKFNKATDITSYYKLT